MTPHYRKIKGFVRRTFADVNEKTMQERALRHAFKVDFMKSRPKDPSLVSSCMGAIDRVLLTIPAYAVSGLGYIYQELLDKLPATTRFLIATHEETKSTIEEWLKARGIENRVELFTIADHLDFSVWAEDGYVIAKDADSGNTYFVEPFSFPRYGDSLISDFAANATDLENTQAPVYFQGGNVLIGDDFFFIGADYPANSMNYLQNHLTMPPGAEPVEFIRELYKEYMDHKRELIYIASAVPVPEEQTREVTVNGEKWTEILYGGNKSGTLQPLFHIDMFLSLAGRDSSGKFRVLVGDPSLAAKEVGEQPNPHAMQAAFDSIAAGLTKRGFAVMRNPLPLAYEDSVERKERFWYFATSNNCLVQIDSQAKNTVWLPTYGHGNWTKLAATDAANRRIWEGFGFEVQQLGDFHPFAANLGALHCIKKYLGRTESAPIS
jgi:hypothetical protein